MANNFPVTTMQVDSTQEATNAKIRYFVCDYLIRNRRAKFWPLETKFIFPHDTNNRVRCLMLELHTLIPKIVRKPVDVENVLRDVCANGAMVQWLRLAWDDVREAPLKWLGAFASLISVGAVTTSLLNWSFYSIFSSSNLLLRSALLPLGGVLTIAAIMTPVIIYGVRSIIRKVRSNSLLEINRNFGDVIQQAEAEMRAASRHADQLVQKFDSLGNNYRDTLKSIVGQITRADMNYPNVMQLIIQLTLDIKQKLEDSKIRVLNEADQAWTDRLLAQIESLFLDVRLEHDVPNVLVRAKRYFLPDFDNNDGKECFAYWSWQVNIEPDAFGWAFPFQYCSWYTPTRIPEDPVWQKAFCRFIYLWQLPNFQRSFERAQYHHHSAHVRRKRATTGKNKFDLRKDSDWVAVLTEVGLATAMTDGVNEVFRLCNQVLPQQKDIGRFKNLQFINRISNIHTIQSPYAAAEGPD